MTGFDGKPGSYDSFAYPDFSLMRALLKDSRRRVIRHLLCGQMDATYRSDQDMEENLHVRPPALGRDVLLVRTPARLGTAAHRAG